MPTESKPMSEDAPERKARLTGALLSCWLAFLVLVCLLCFLFVGLPTFLPQLGGVGDPWLPASIKRIQALPAWVHYTIIGLLVIPMTWLDHRRMNKKPVPSICSYIAWGVVALAVVGVVIFFLAMKYGYPAVH